jgi:hypothetical protein
MNYLVMKHYHDWNELFKNKNSVFKKRRLMNRLPEFNCGLKGVRLLPNSTVSDEETSLKENIW